MDENLVIKDEKKCNVDEKFLSVENFFPVRQIKIQKNMENNDEKTEKIQKKGKKGTTKKPSMKRKY